MGGYTKIVPYKRVDGPYPRNKGYICIERGGPKSDQESNSLAPSPLVKLETVGIVHVDVIERGSIGCYYGRCLHRRPHYDLLEAELWAHKEKANSRNINWELHPITGKTKTLLCEGTPYCTFLANGVDLEGLVSKLEMPAILQDAVLKEKAQLVASVDPLRGSRGFSIGWTGCQCLSKKKDEPAAPVLARGTLRYTDFACRLSDLVKCMCEKAGFREPFLGGDPIYGSRREDYASCISPGNILESISFKCYIHDLEWIGGGSDRLNIHVDLENCPEEGWDGCGVAYQDYFSEPLGRWITMVAIGTSRKSVSEAIGRSITLKSLKRVVSLLEEGYRKTPASRREITELSICPDAYHRDHKTLPIHYHPTVHLSPCLEFVLKVGYIAKCSVSRFLVVEAIYCFVLTNNSLRFYRFTQCFFRDGNPMEEGGGWKIPLDERAKSTFTSKFLNFLVFVYGTSNGKLGKKRLVDKSTRKTTIFSSDQRTEEEGPRWLPAANHPRTEQSIWKSLWWINKILGDLDSKETPTRKDYRQAMSLMAKQAQGVNTLLSQKIIILGIMTGLLHDREWLSFLQPGSPSHFQTLLDPPYSLASKSQIPQMVDLLHKKLKVSVPYASTEVKSYYLVKSKS